MHHLKQILPNVLDTLGGLPMYASSSFFVGSYVNFLKPFVEKYAKLSKLFPTNCSNVVEIRRNVHSTFPNAKYVIKELIRERNDRVLENIYKILNFSLTQLEIEECIRYKNYKALKFTNPEKFVLCSPMLCQKVPHRQHSIYRGKYDVDLNIIPQVKLLVKVIDKGFPQGILLRNMNEICIKIDKYTIFLPFINIDLVPEWTPDGQNYKDSEHIKSQFSSNVWRHFTSRFYDKTPRLRSLRHNKNTKLLLELKQNQLNLNGINYRKIWNLFSIKT